MNLDVRFLCLTLREAVAALLLLVLVLIVLVKGVRHPKPFAAPVDRQDWAVSVALAAVTWWGTQHWAAPLGVALYMALSYLRAYLFRDLR